MSCASPASSVPWRISPPPGNWWKPIIPGPRSTTCKPSAPPRALSPPAKPSRDSFQPEKGEPLAALVAAQHVVLTGTQVSYGYQEANSRLAFGRMQKALEG